jgi:hypothetical protein
VFVLSDHRRRVPAGCAFPSGGLRAPRITALGGLALGRPRHPANQNDEHTEIAAPTMSPTTWTHHPVKSPLTMSGPSVRAGFIEAPLIGLANRPIRATVASQAPERRHHLLGSR